MAQSDKGMPQVGMLFKSSEEAWLFWRAYGGRAGFDVRKRYNNVSKFDGKVTSCRFVCANEGHQKKGQREFVQKCFRAQTRTDCKARMSLTLDRESGNMEITDVVLEHNHLLHLPQTRHLMASQRKISEFQVFEIEAADDSGIRPQAAYELATRQVGGPLNLGYTPRDHRNHLQSKRQRELAFGQAGSMLKYFQDKIVENPSFQYALQLDCEEDITNIFWADAKMMLDYAHFGDVVTKKGAKQKKKNDDVQPVVEVANDGSKRSANAENEKYIAIESFTQLLTAPPTCGDDSIYGGNFF